MYEILTEVVVGGQSREVLESVERLETLSRPPVPHHWRALEEPDSQEAGNERLEENERMNPAGTAAPAGVTGNLEGGDGDTRRRTAGGKASTRPGGTTVVPTVPKTVVEEPWHLARRSCRPKFAEVEKPSTMLGPSVTQTWRPIKP